MKELKIYPRSGTNFGPGDLDIQIQEGHLMFVEDDDVVPQAIIKMTISSLHPKIGYGVALREFRGTKEIVPLRTAIMLRILKGISLITKWYGKTITIKSVDIIDDPAEANFRLKINVNGLNIVI